MISILLVDDHTIVRQALRQLLETEDNYAVVGEASTGEEGFRKYFELQPDVILLDLMLPGEGGLATMRRIHNRDASARILVLSMYDDPGIVIRTLDYGARGYISKSAAPDELKHAVKLVASGQPYLERRIHDDLHARTIQEQHPALVLTARELEVFSMLADGRSVMEIASLLHLSDKTVGAHQTSILKKLKLQNSAQLVRTAILWGITKI